MIKEKLIREKEKQRRAKMFVEIGRLAYNANIDQLEKSLLLGAFLEIAQKIKEKDALKKWELNVAEYQKANAEKNTVPLSVKFKTEPEREIKSKMKELKFRWNSFRHEFYGRGNRQQIEKLLDGKEFTIEEISE